MKPTPQIPHSRSRRDFVARADRHVAAPKTDYSLRADSLNEFRPCAGKCNPSFRDISESYFEDEAPRAFATEAAVFALIVITSAVPIFQSASTLFHMVRAFAL